MPTTAPALRTATFHVGGMTCTSCAARVKTALEGLPEVASAEVDKATDTATVHLSVPAAATYLNTAIGERYALSPQTTAPPAAPQANAAPPGAPQAFLTTYRPLLTIVGLVALVAVLAQAPFSYGIDGMLFMRHFMAGFFLVFAGFKLLDVAGFSDSYAMYDVVAQRWRGWGTLYPFVELALGLAYLTDVAPFWTNIATVVILGVSAIGVVQSVRAKRTIECACLGTGFNLPMSTVTIVEDVGMVAMAAGMLLYRLA